GPSFEPLLCHNYFESRHAGSLKFPRYFIFRQNRCQPPSHHFRRCSLSRFNSLTALVSLGLLLALSGCQKPADQAANSDSTASDPSKESSSPSGGSSSSARSRETVAKPLVVPAD